MPLSEYPYLGPIDARNNYRVPERSAGERAALEAWANGIGQEQHPREKRIRMIGRKALDHEIIEAPEDIPGISEALRPDKPRK